MHLTAGLDLAAVRDHSALVIVERVLVATSETQATFVKPYDDELGWFEDRMVPEEHFLVRHLVQWPRGVDPGDVVVDVGHRLDDPFVGRYIKVRYDATGMGVGVRSIISERYRRGLFGAHSPTPVTITGGQESNGWNVAKVDLVSTLVRVQRERRLHLPRGLEHAEQLRAELLRFQVKVTASGRETYAAQTESVHDDMVLALALAVYRPGGHAQPRCWAPEELAAALGTDRSTRA